jgi:3-hydroxybutyryl-CoA dehydrogenase
MTVAIIGAGALGRWLALESARAGFRVLLEDVMPSKLALAAREAESEQLDAIEQVRTVEDAVRDADLAVDCVPDELESKLEILWLLDRMAPPKTVIATPTIALSIADLAACTYRPERVVAVALDPRSLSLSDAGSKAGAQMPLRTTLKTLPQATELVAEFWRKLGFVPQIEVAAD